MAINGAVGSFSAVAQFLRLVRGIHAFASK